MENLLKECELLKCMYQIAVRLFGERPEAYSEKHIAEGYFFNPFSYCRSEDELIRYVKAFSKQTCQASNAFWLEKYTETMLTVFLTYQRHLQGNIIYSEEADKEYFIDTDVPMYGIYKYLEKIDEDNLSKVEKDCYLSIAVLLQPVNFYR